MLPLVQNAPNLAFSEPMPISQARAKPSPWPVAGPFSMAVTGFIISCKIVGKASLVLLPKIRFAVLTCAISAWQYSPLRALAKWDTSGQGESPGCGFSHATITCLSSRSHFPLCLRI